MSSGWKEVKIEEICRIRRGASPRPIHEYITESGIPWVKISDATASSSRFINKTKEFIKIEGKDKSRFITKGTLILSNSATPGIPKIMGIDACVHDGWLIIDEYKDMYYSFLYYTFNNERDKLLNLSNGSVFRNLKTDIVKNYSINIPPLDEQKSIAHILSTLDDKIEINNQINKTLEKMAQTIFKHWFVDFEFPNEDGEPYKSSGGEMVDSELGMIPKGWEVKKTNQVIDYIKESTKPGEHLKCRKYIPIDTMSMKSVTINEFKPYEEANSSLILFEEFDILIGAMRVYFHRVNLAPFRGVTRTTTFVLRSKIKEDISYNLFLLNLDETINYADKTSKGTTMPYAIWENGLAEMMVIYPTEKLRIKFNDMVFPMLEKMISNSKENRCLKEIRDTLLPKLMSGEIRVPLEEGDIQ